MIANDLWYGFLWIYKQLVLFYVKLFFRVWYTFSKSLHLAYIFWGHQHLETVFYAFLIFPNSISLSNSLKKINVLFNVFIMFLEFFARLACSKQNNFLRNVFITFYLHWAIFLTGIPIQPIFPFFLYGFGLKLQDDFMLLDRYFLYQIVE